MGLLYCVLFLVMLPGRRSDLLGRSFWCWLFVVLIAPMFVPLCSSGQGCNLRCPWPRPTDSTSYPLPCCGSHPINTHSGQGRGRRGSEEDLRHPKGGVSARNAPSQISAPALGRWWCPSSVVRDPSAFHFQGHWVFVLTQLISMFSRELRTDPWGLFLGQGTAIWARLGGQRQSLTSLESLVSGDPEWSYLAWGAAYLLWSSHQREGYVQWGLFTGLWGAVSTKRIRTPLINSTTVGVMLPLIRLPLRRSLAAHGRLMPLVSWRCSPQWLGS